MSDIQPGVNEGDVVRVLAECKSGDVTSIKRQSHGQISSTFDCEVSGDALVVQFNKPNMAASLFKERMFRDRFSTAGVPVRRVLCDGSYKDLKFTVAERAHGVGFSELEPTSFAAALPSVFTALSALESIDISETSGFGWFDENGIAPYATWRDHLCQVREEEPGMFYGNWHEMFKTTFLERDRFDAIFERMSVLLDQLDPPRALVHGGFGYDNILVEDDNVSAVLDWQDARFGDPLFDVAYMDYWPSGYDLVEMYEMYCHESGRVFHRYRERIIACKLYTGLDSMRFFAKVGNRKAYDSTLEIVAGLPL